MPPIRPWPIPTRPWIMAMQWHDLLFMHWPLPPAILAPHLPPLLRLDTFDGAAWIGIVPFMMRGVRLRGTPPLPGLSAFAELNVRTYVTINGKPGVWFFSLDAANPLAVRGARLTFHLPYFDAAMQVAREGDGIRYQSRRTHRLVAPATFAAAYRPIGPPTEAPANSLVDWLTARYCLYTSDRRSVWRGEIDHVPWPLQPAEAEIAANMMTAPLRLALPAIPPLLHFVRRLDVVAWAPELANASL